MFEVDDSRPPDEAVAVPSPATAEVIRAEFLKLLGRTEVEHPIICQRVCICQQFWRYQHYFLPRWEWGINRVVCLGLGSFRNVKRNGGPFGEQSHTYRDTIRKQQLVEAFNTRPVDRHNALQVMLRHVAALEIASSMKFCSSRRGIEHQLIKYYFKKLTAIQNLAVLDENANKSDKAVKTLEKSPPTAGYDGDKDLIDIPVYFQNSGYTEEDKSALRGLSDIFKMAHLPPVHVIEADDYEVTEAPAIVDEHTLVYAVDPGCAERQILLQGRTPGAIIWRDRVLELESNDALARDIYTLLNGYAEFKLDRKMAPHTVGASHLYIRRDIVEKAEKEGIVPPYPVNFPHDYPHEHKDWYLGKVKKSLRDMKACN